MEFGVEVIEGQQIYEKILNRSVNKEFPGVEMERRDKWGQEVWNYVIADDKWQVSVTWSQL